MRMLTFGLTAAFTLGLALATSPVLADGDCGWGHSTKTAESSSPFIAEGQTQQTVKPDQGS
jgi:hypothetical protein